MQEAGHRSDVTALIIPRSAEAKKNPAIAVEIIVRVEIVGQHVSSGRNLHDRNSRERKPH